MSTPKVAKTALFEQKNEKKRIKKNYINNPDMYDALVAYKELIKTKPDAQISNYLGECFMKINEKLATKGNFSGYTYKDQMIADGIENCLIAVLSFNPEKGFNPFAYFTQISWFAFLRRIEKEQKETYIKHKNMQHVVLFGEYNNQYIGDDLLDSDLSNKVIKDYEDRMERKKNKKPANTVISTVDNDTNMMV